MKKGECPCYTCLVAACCPGKEPCPGEWSRIDKEVDEDMRSGKYYDELEEQEDDDLWKYEVILMPEFEAQMDCPQYVKWTGIHSREEFEKECVKDAKRVFELYK